MGEYVSVSHSFRTEKKCKRNWRTLVVTNVCIDLYVKSYSSDKEVLLSTVVTAFCGQFFVPETSKSKEDLVFLLLLKFAPPPYPPTRQLTQAEWCGVPGSDLTITGGWGCGWSSE